MIELRWTPQAADDLQAIHDFIARDSERYAAAEAQRILVAVDQIESFPKSGRIVPEHGREDLRELVLAPYRLSLAIRGGRCLDGVSSGPPLASAARRVGERA